MTLQAHISASRKGARVRKRRSETMGTPVTESALHLATAEFLEYAVTPPAWWTTIPLGGGGMVRGAMLKMRGAKVGTPDILLIRAGRAYWIELKTKRGSLSEHQKLTAIDLRNADCPWAVCRSVDEVEARLIEWGFQLRARLGRVA